MLVQGAVFTVSAPSGVGKTSLVKKILMNETNILKSVSYTTRKQRNNEIHSKDYFFVSPDEFQHKIDAGEFLEYARVYQHLYGTSKEWLLQQLNKGIDVILEIDWQGAYAVKELLPNAVSIFILPPSKDELLRRLKTRATDTDEIIQSRFTKVSAEVKKIDFFDYAVINDDFNNAVTSLSNIIKTEKLKLKYQKLKLKHLLEELTV